MLINLAGKAKKYKRERAMHFCFSNTTSKFERNFEENFESLSLRSQTTKIQDQEEVGNIQVIYILLKNFKSSNLKMYTSK